MLRHEHSLVPR